MKRLMSLLVVALLAPAGARAQGGHIGVYGDSLGTQCRIDVPTSGIVKIFVVHKLGAPTGGSEFTVSSGGNFNGVYLGEYFGTNAVSFGNSQTGIAIGYGGCWYDQVHILTVSYYVPSEPPVCSYIDIVDFDLFGNAPPGIHSVDCDGNMWDALGGRAYVNGDGTCDCATPNNTTTPVEESTWGAIKTVYR